MQRLATTVALAAWIGFLGVFSLAVAASILAPDLLFRVTAMPWPQAVAIQFGGMASLVGDLPRGLGLPLAMACLSIVVVFARSLLLFQTDSRAARGETLALAGLGVVAVLAGIAQTSALPLLPIDLDGGFVWLAIALSIAAVTFDRLVAVDEEAEKADADFYASFAVLAERMGRQAALDAACEAGQRQDGMDRRP